MLLHASDSASCASWMQSGDTPGILSASPKACRAKETLAARGGSIMTIWMLTDPSPPAEAPDVHLRPLQG
jgi:hypothetical protein